MKTKLGLKEIFLGHVSSYFLTRVIEPLLLIIFSVFIAISWVLYPNYDWTQMDISYLGVPERNPDGWIFWSIGLTLTGTLFIPIISYLKLILIVLNKLSIKIAIYLLHFSAIGSIGLGMIPQFPGAIFYVFHIVNASFIFGGLYIAINLITIILLKDKSMRKKLIFVLIFSIGVPISFGTTQGIRTLLFTNSSEISWILRFSMWEWLLLFGVFIAFFILIHVLQKKNS